MVICQSFFDTDDILSINMSISSEKVKRWRKRFKNKIVEWMGGGCAVCGYNKCQSSLALHHIDPSKKEISFGSVRANPKNWDKIVSELKKCVLVCHNCHNEIHEGITEIPNEYIKFDEVKYGNYIKSFKISQCPICDKDKDINLKYCSKDCIAKARYVIDWDSIDLKKELETKSIISLSKELGCSDNAIHKRLKKIGLK